MPSSSSEYPVKEFLKYAQHNSVPAYVKKASTQDIENAADPKSKSAVYLAVFSKMAGSGYCKLSAAELTRRADLLGAGNDCVKLIQDMDSQFKAAAEKQAAERKPVVEEKYPVRSAEEWNKAASWLHRNAYNIPIADRRELAGKLIKTAAEFGLPEPDDKLYQHAGAGMCDPYKVAYEFIKRAELVSISPAVTAQERQATADDLQKLAALIGAQPSTSSTVEWQDKLAATAQVIDNIYDLSKHYGTYIQEPDAFAYSLLFKQGEYIAQNSCKLSNGDVFDRCEFTKLSTEDISNYFNPELTKAVTTGLNIDPVKLAEAASYFEATEADLLSGILADKGVYPKIKTAAHRRIEKKAMYELGRVLNTS